MFSLRHAIAGLVMAGALVFAACTTQKVEPNRQQSVETASTRAIAFANKLEAAAKVGDTAVAKDAAVELITIHNSGVAVPFGDSTSKIWRQVELSHLVVSRRLYAMIKDRRINAGSDSLHALIDIMRANLVSAGKNRDYLGSPKTLQRMVHADLVAQAVRNAPTVVLASSSLNARKSRAAASKSKVKKPTMKHRTSAHPTAASKVASNR